ncbi:MAG: phospholipase D-like domain-containing protein [Proteobacteria bacterium]|nr:phospholipase D-like domain-containing protein [Pseudomonadota bacterium]
MGRYPAAAGYFTVGALGRAHTAAIVVDGARAFIGSENFTANSLGYNREVGVLFQTASEVGTPVTGQRVA